eukprot:CRZ06471.1 hypothetical protein [Spongospora subterranea]
MGRPACAARFHVKKLETKVNKKVHFFICIHCFNAHAQNPDSFPEPELVQGRKECFDAHLETCQFFPNQHDYEYDESAVVDLTVSSKRSRSCEVSQGGLSAGSTMLKQAVQKKVTSYFRAPYSRHEVAKFETLLLEFQSDNQLPESLIEQQSTKKLFNFVCQSSSQSLPSRSALGTIILDQYADNIDQQQRSRLMEMQTATGGRLNFLSDAWQNVSKRHLLGCMLGMFGVNISYGLFPVGSRHDAIAIAEQMEKIMIEMVQSGWKLGAVITDNAGQCGRARRILVLRWPSLVFLHCFAHDINNLVKAILKTVFHEVASQAMRAVACINQSSSKWLVRVRDPLMETYGKNLAFISLCETRWNSMQGCFASLLRVRSALEMLAAKYRTDSEFPAALKVFGTSEFWFSLSSAEEIIRPLSSASFKLQRDENTMTDILISMREIYQGFANSDQLVPLIESRWNVCEQPLIMLTLFLHPQYITEARSLPETMLTAVNRICDIAIYYYRRLVDHDYGNLRGDMFKWIEGNLIDVSFSEFDGHVQFWQYVKKSMRNCKIPVLAMTILSVAVNTATCERLFSELSLIHTAKRNRLLPEKVRKTAIVRKNVREQDDSGSKSKADQNDLIARIVQPAERCKQRMEMHMNFLLPTMFIPKLNLNLSVLPANLNRM